MRQAEEHDVEPVDAVGVERLEHEVRVGTGEARVQRRRRGTPACESPVATTTSKLRVLGGEPQQLGAGEPRRTDDPDPQHDA